MSAHPLKQFLYHHTITAKLYNIIRSYRRDRYNKLSDEEFANLLHMRHTARGWILKTLKPLTRKCGI